VGSIPTSFEEKQGFSQASLGSPPDPPPSGGEQGGGIGGQGEGPTPKDNGSSKPQPKGGKNGGGGKKEEKEMIQLLTKVTIIDNTGGKVGTCIKVLAPKNRKEAKVGDIILVSIKKTAANSKVTRGGLYKGLVVRTKKEIDNGVTKTKYSSNAIVLIKQAQSKKKHDYLPIGTRIKGAISSKIQKQEGCLKIHYMAKNTQ
jgi:large subunit ribosomal protein L14